MNTGDIVGTIFGFGYMAFAIGLSIWIGRRSR